jgi:fructose-1,6-bisphosphatase/inositol monophosphatase family enzyme
LIPEELRVAFLACVPSPERSTCPRLERIQSAIEASKIVFSRYPPGEVAAEYKAGHDSVTKADRALDTGPRQNLLRPSEGWLSEERVGVLSRLDRELVWAVDPRDGTREFVAGIP